MPYPGDQSAPVHVIGRTAGKSYRAAVWLPAKVVEAKRGQLLRNFLNKVAAGEVESSPDDAIDPVWYQVGVLRASLQAATEANH